VQCDEMNGLSYPSKGERDPHRNFRGIPGWDQACEGKREQRSGKRTGENVNQKGICAINIKKRTASRDQGRDGKTWRRKNFARVISGDL